MSVSSAFQIQSSELKTLHGRYTSSEHYQTSPRKNKRFMFRFWLLIIIGANLIQKGQHYL